MDVDASAIGVTSPKYTTEFVDDAAPVATRLHCSDTQDANEEAVPETGIIIDAIATEVETEDIDTGIPIGIIGETEDADTNKGLGLFANNIVTAALDDDVRGYALLITGNNVTVDAALTTTGVTIPNNIVFDVAETHVASALIFDPCSSMAITELVDNAGVTASARFLAETVSADEETAPTTGINTRVPLSVA